MTTAKKKATATGAKYIEGIGRRKTAVARVRMTPAGKNSMVINGKDAAEYFGPSKLATTALSPVAREGAEGKYEISVKVVGGGTSAQAEAIRHGLSRALVMENAEIKGSLKSLGFLKRDSREVERKHFGYKKARKASQWSKR